MKCLLILLIAFPIAIYSQPGGDSLSVIDPARICAHIRELASDTYQGRKPGTIGESLTIDYLSRQFEEIGLEKPFNTSYLQEVRINTCTFKAPQSIEIETPRGVLNWENKTDYLLSSELESEFDLLPKTEIVYAGFGIHAPELEWDDFKGVDIKGKILIVLADVPGEYTTDTTLWKGDPAANIYSKGFYKRNEASRRGAVALLTVYKKNRHAMYTWESLSNVIGVDDRSIEYPSEESRISFYGLLSQRAAEQLFSHSGMQGQTYIEKALDPSFKPVSLGSYTTFSYANVCETLTTHNVGGVLPGTDLKDELMVYSAHWDHVGLNPDLPGDKIYNGAVDNASGTAALIELARNFKMNGANRRSVLFLATTAEEMGLLGSVWYNHYPVFPISKTAANFNMDSHYPYGGNSHITAVVYGRTGLDKYLEEAAAIQGRTLVSNRDQNIAMDIFFRSDHFPFAESGIPSEFAVGFGEAVGHDNDLYQEKLSAYMYKYHQPTDEYEDSFDCTGIAMDADFIYTAGRLLDREGAFPEWNEGQPFAELRHKTRFETEYFRDVSDTHLPKASTQGRTMDARPVDIDNDGDIDLVLAGEHAFNTILVNDGKGYFSDQTIERIPLKSYDTEDIAAADFDLDGDVDLFFASEDNRVNELYMNDGKGFFEDWSEKIPVSGKSNAVAVMDVNLDGFPDLIVGNDGRNYCLLNLGNGRWLEDSSRLPGSIKTTQDIEIGDIDSDVDEDILCGNEDDSEVWLNDGKGVFTLEAGALTIQAGEWETREIDLGDIDNDGDLDIIMSNVRFRENKNPQNRLFLNDGSGKYTDVTETHLPKALSNSTDADFIDLDADNDLDIVIGNVFGASYAVYKNEGGRYTEDTERFIPASVRGEGIDIESADFNGDGKVDLYLGNFRGSDFLLLAK